MEPGSRKKKNKKSISTNWVININDMLLSKRYNFILLVGGGRILGGLLEAPLNAFSIANTAICIVVDLSVPGNVIDSLLYWLNVV